MAWTKDEFKKLYARFTESGLSIPGIIGKVVLFIIQDKSYAHIVSAYRQTFARRGLPNVYIMHKQD